MLIRIAAIVTIQATQCFELNLRNDFLGDSGSDLSPLFTSAPDIRPPAWNISIYSPDLVSPGYIFAAPYTALKHIPYPLEYQPAQIGPAIFDLQGELVWSGARQFSNRNMFDFKIANKDDDGSPIRLSVIYGANYFRHVLPHGAGLLLDNSYQVISRTDVPTSSVEFNKHEYKLVDGGRSALVVTTIPDEVEGVRVYNNGFAEIDIATGDILFEWNPLRQIDLTASYDSMPQQIPKLRRNYIEHYPVDDSGPLCGYHESEPWDWIHVNSVDKTSNGDYVISARATSAIYRISRHDGSIIWELGGKRSSFILDGFNFSHQHDARVLVDNSTMTILSLHNNAADDKGRSHQTSAWTSAMIVSLDLTTMTAVLLRQWDRPDHGLSLARGNVQILPNSNAFVCWSDNGYVSEFTDNGTLAFEARFRSHRYTTYRAYRFNFTGNPLTKPDLVSQCYGHSRDTAVTVHYVSWNGATEVKSWKFYGSNSNDSHASFSDIGQSAKSGFETTLQTARCTRYIYVEGLAADGRVLGRSNVAESTVIALSIGDDKSSWTTYAGWRTIERILTFSIFCLLIFLLTKGWTRVSPHVYTELNSNH